MKVLKRIILTLFLTQSLLHISILSIIGLINLFFDINLISAYPFIVVPSLIGGLIGVLLTELKILS